MRSRFRFVPALIAVSALVCACGSTSPAPPGNNVGTQLDGAVRPSIQQLPLKDSSGHTVRLADFKGKVVVLSDTMTLCAETCPIDTASVVQTARELDRAGNGSDVVFLTVTVDPQRDTVPQMAAYRKLFAPTPANWHALTGSPAVIHELWKYFGVYIKKVAADPGAKNWRTGKPLTYDLDHSDEVFFFDKAGKERFVLEGVPHVPNRKDVPATLYRYLSREGRNNIAHPKKTAWTVPQAKQVIAWLQSVKS